MSTCVFGVPTEPPERLASSSSEDFDLSKAVWRPEFADQISNYIDRGLEGKPLPYSVLEYYGAPGVGKTWLLKRAEVEAKERPRGKKGRIAVYFIDLEESVFQKKGERLTSPDEKRTGEYQERFRKELSGQLRSTEVLPLSQVVNQVGETKDKIFYIFILDTAEYLAYVPQFHRWLERELVLPLARTDRVFFLLGSRYKLRWREFSVRYRLQQKEVKGFTPDEIRSLAGKYGVDDRRREELVERIYHDYTWGHAMATAGILGSVAKKGPQVSPSDLNEIAAKRLGDVIDGFMGSLFLFPGEVNMTQLCQYLSVGSILRVFTEGTLFRLRKSFYESQNGDIEIFLLEKPAPGFQDIFDNLRQTTLITWSNEWGGYIVDQTTRYVLASWLRLKNPEEFYRRHAIAKDYYGWQLDQAPLNLPRAAVEYLYHSAWYEMRMLEGKRLEPLGKEAVKDLQEDFIYKLRDALRHPSMHWYETDHLNAIDELIKQDQEQDQELGFLLSPNGVENIRGAVQALREQFR